MLPVICYLFGMAAFLSYNLAKVKELHKEPLREAFLELQAYTREREKLLQKYVSELNTLKANQLIAAPLDQCDIPTTIGSHSPDKDNVLLELARQLSVRTDQCMQFQKELLELKLSPQLHQTSTSSIPNPSDRVSSGTPTSYLQAALHNRSKPTVSNPTHVPSKLQQPKHIPKLVNPEHSLIIEKVENPLRYYNTLHLKSALLNADSSIIPLISTAKVTSSGTVLIEAKEPAARELLLAKIEPHTVDIFGSDAVVRSMSDVPQGKTSTVIVRSLPGDYDAESVKAEVLSEYPSLKSITSLLKPGSGARYQSFKLEIADGNDLARILEHGVHVGLCIYRACTWIPSPRQCYRCQRYNHLSTTCRSDHRCVVCSEGHTPDKNCQKATKCANCGEAHKASFNGCSTRKAFMSEQRSNLMTQ